MLTPPGCANVHEWSTQRHCLHPLYFLTLCSVVQHNHLLWKSLNTSLPCGVCVCVWFNTQTEGRDNCCFTDCAPCFSCLCCSCVNHTHTSKCLFSSHSAKYSHVILFYWLIPNQKVNYYSCCGSYHNGNTKYSEFKNYLWLDCDGQTWWVTQRMFLYSVHVLLEYENIFTRDQRGSFSGSSVSELGLFILPSTYHSHI